MNSSLIKVYGFFAGVSLLAFLLSGTLADAQEPAASVLSPHDQSRVINLANNMTLKLEATNTRLQDIATRTKFNQGWMKDDEGFDFPDVTQKLENFDSLFSENQAILENIHQQVYQAVTSTEPKNQWQAVRNQYLLVNGNLKEMYQNLDESLNTMIRAFDERHGTTTERILTGDKPQSNESVILMTPETEEIATSSAATSTTNNL